MTSGLVLLRKSASNRATIAAFTGSVESLHRHHHQHNRNQSHFSAYLTGPDLYRNALYRSIQIQNSMSIRWRFSGGFEEFLLRSFHVGPSLHFRPSVSALEPEFSMADFVDEDKSRGHAATGDDGLEISKLGTSEHIVSALAKKGITKLFPIQSMSSFVACRRLSTSILTPESKDAGAFPSHLLSTKRTVTPEHTQGLYQDLVIPVTNFRNESKGFMVLSGDVFDVPIRKDIVHRVVRWQLAKRRQGTHSTKTISEVSGTGKKPWPQKGSGRARHGTLRGPQFRGGAIMHGPKPRSHAIKLNKKVRRLGLKITLSARAAEGKLLVFEDLDVPTHKTKNIVNYVNQMENTKKILLVDGGPLSENLKLATQNLHYVNILPSIGLNVYSILLHDTLVMSRDAVNKIVQRMHTPINR